MAAAADLRAAGFGLSAMIVDTIFSSDGIHPDPSVLAPACAVVRRAGGVVITDEVQPGFARTGDAMWGFLRHGVVPDIVTMGKPMGNGLPIAAMAARAAVLDDFARGVPYFNTFGGNPVTVAAAAAVLDVIGEENLMANAAAVVVSCRPSSRRSPNGIRGSGTFAAPACTSGGDRHQNRRPRPCGGPRTGQRHAERQSCCRCGHDGNVLKIRPPLVFSPADTDWFCTELEAALTATS